MARNESRLQICRIIRLQGFRIDPKCRWGMRGGGHPKGTLATLFYLKDVGNRTLELQLEADGTGRISHMVYRDHPEPRHRGRMTTHPTGFTDIPSLKAAVAHETARMDNLFYVEGTVAA